MGKNGWYTRPLPVGGKWELGPIYRRRCRHCGIPWTIFPGFAVPRRQYSLALIVSWLLAWLRGAPFRDQAFLREQGIVIPTDPTVCWTDLVDQEPIQPGYQLLHRWTRDFQRRASRLLETLVPAANWGAIELKTLAHLLEAEEFSGFRASPLVLAGGLLALLPLPRAPDTDISAEACLSDLLRVLSARRLPLSHQVLRVSSGRIRYDTLVL